MRVKVRKPMTDKAKDLVCRQMEKIRTAGHDAIEALEKSTRNSWLDVYMPGNGNGGGKNDW